MPLTGGIARIKGHRLNQGPGRMAVDIDGLIRVGGGQGGLDFGDRAANSLGFDNSGRSRHRRRRKGDYSASVSRPASRSSAVVPTNASSMRNGWDWASRRIM